MSASVLRNLCVKGGGGSIAIRHKCHAIATPVSFVS